MPPRKTSTTPTRIYSYRCLPPITEAERVEDQFRLAHRYHNTLVEVEHRLRDAFREVVLGCAETAAAQLHADDCSAATDDAFADVRASKAASIELTQAQIDRIESCKEMQKAAWAALRAAKQQHVDALKPGYERARELAHTWRLAARHEFTAQGLRHGAYAAVEKAIEAASRDSMAPPKFHRYDGEGSIGTQLQAIGTGPKGLTVPELCSGHDTRLRLGQPGELDHHPRPEVAGTTWATFNQLGANLRCHAARTYVDLRVGSNPDRTPIFARFPVTMHRPLPKDALIKWAYVVRKRIGRRYEWRMQFTIESETFHACTQPVGEGVAALNLGWRNLLDDEGTPCAIRVGMIVNDQGQQEELLVPDKVRTGFAKPHDLASIRRQHFNKMLANLAEFCAAQDVPPWLRDDAAYFHAWKAERRLAQLLNRWRRFDGDATIYVELQAWAKQDRHLLDWQAHQTASRIAHRRAVFREIAARLCRTYATILIDKVDLRTFAELPEPHEGDPSDDRDQRRTARVSAPGELRDAIRKAAPKHGATIIEAKGAFTVRCHHCASTQEWDRRGELTHTCTACAATWDQDVNACRNMLAGHVPPTASGPAPSTQPLALAS